FGCVVVIEIVRRELKIPFELASSRIEGQQAIGVEVIARPWVSIKIGCRIARAPENGVELGIKSTRHPSGPAAELVALAGPTRGAKFARSRDGPKTPRFFSGFGIVSRNKATHTVVPTGSSHDDFVLDD